MEFFGFYFLVYRIQRIITCMTDDLTKKNFGTTHGHKGHICVHDWIQITYSVTRAIHEVSWNITRKPVFRLFTVWIPRSLHFLEDMSAKTTQDAKQWMLGQLPCLFQWRKIQHHHTYLSIVWKFRSVWNSVPFIFMHQQKGNHF